MRKEKDGLRPLTAMAKNDFGVGHCACCGAVVFASTVEWTDKEKRGGYTPICPGCKVDALFVLRDDALAYHKQFNVPFRLKALIGKLTGGGSVLTMYHKDKRLVVVVERKGSIYVCEGEVK